MIPTKSDIINDAFSQLRISGITADATSGEKELALNRMESMCAEFEGRNICLNYQFEETPDPATSSGVALEFKQMMATNLALRLVPDFGKNEQQSPSLARLSRQATQSLSNASARTAVVNKIQYSDRMSVGSGNTFRGSRIRRFFRPEADAPISCDTEQLKLNTMDSFIVSWVNFLDDGETITSFKISSTDGLELSEAQIQNNSTEVFYKAKAIKDGYQVVTISIVTTATSPNFADVKTINFNVVANLS